jgi:uncharacterized protein YbbC (DUF1343 family)
VGLDNLSNHLDLFQDKRIGIITNHTAYDSNDLHIIDIFASLPGVRIIALFGPEHGIQGKEAAGKKITNTFNTHQNIPVYSLYGENLKPTAQMLRNIDMLVFDVQDIGTRFYTYASTMSLAMEAAAENQITFVVLDRPNPINGENVEGNLLEPAFATFVGLHPIPVRHGMTMGELAKMINEERWLKNEVYARLEIIPLNHWKRHMWYDQTGLKWRAPSPNMPDLDVATVYPGTCLFEGTNISEGRGTYRPFLRLGAPWIKNNHLSIINKIVDTPGLHLGPLSFTPRSIAAMSPHPKYLNQKIRGVSLAVTNRNTYRSYLSGITLVKFFYEANKEKFGWRERHFDRLCGTAKIRQFIVQGKSIEDIQKWVDKDVNSFKELRNKYLLY